MIASLNLRAALVSFLIAAGFLAAWHVAVRSGASGPALDPEYAKLLGATATTGKSAMPGPLEVGAKILEHLSAPFYDKIGRAHV